MDENLELMRLLLANLSMRPPTASACLALKTIRQSFLDCVVPARRLFDVIDGSFSWLNGAS
jgi:hypothetical protein